MKYYIAYKDKSGNDFHGTLWITPEGGFNDLLIAKYEKGLMLSNNNYTHVVLFESNKIPEMVTWKYVDKHKISD